MTGACAVAQPVRPVTKIGLAAPFEGQYRYVGYEAMYAARLALREANATGGVGGYSVELVAYDDQGTADGARTAARNLVLDPSVGAVIGHFRDESNEVAQVLYDSAGLPTINAGSVDGFGDHQGNLICLFLLRLAHETSDEGQGAAPGSAANRMLGPVHVQWVTDNEALPRCDDRLSFTASSQFPPADDTDVVFLKPCVLCVMLIGTVLSRGGLPLEARYSLRWAIPKASYSHPCIAGPISTIGMPRLQHAMRLWVRTFRHLAQLPYRPTKLCVVC
jgi:hypothetical protein